MGGGEGKGVINGPKKRKRKKDKIPKVGKGGEKPEGE